MYVLRSLLSVIILFGVSFIISLIVTPIVVILHDKYKAREYDKKQRALHEEIIERAKRDKKKTKDDLSIIINKTEEIKHE